MIYNVFVSCDSNSHFSVSEIGLHMKDTIGIIDFNLYFLERAVVADNWLCISGIVGNFV